MNDITTWPLISTPVEVYEEYDRNKYICYDSLLLFEINLSKSVQSFESGENIYIVAMWISLKTVNNIKNYLYGIDLII